MTSRNLQRMRKGRELLLTLGTWGLKEDHLQRVVLPELLSGESSFFHQNKQNLFVSMFMFLKVIFVLKCPTLAH